MEVSLSKTTFFSSTEEVCDKRGAWYIAEYGPFFMEKMMVRVANSIYEVWNEAWCIVVSFLILFNDQILRLMRYAWLLAIIFHFEIPSFTTGKRYFAMCQNLRRVHYFGHTTKNSFAVCLQKNTRQRKNTRETLLFAVCQGPAHDKPWSSPWVSQ